MGRLVALYLLKGRNLIVSNYQDKDDFSHAPTQAVRPVQKRSAGNAGKGLPMELPKPGKKKGWQYSWPIRR